MNAISSNPFFSFVENLNDEQRVQLADVLKYFQNNQTPVRERHYAGKALHYGDELSMQISCHDAGEFAEDHFGWSLWIQYDIRRAGEDLNHYWITSDGWVRVLLNESSKSEFFVDINAEATVLRAVDPQTLEIVGTCEFKMKAYDAECAKLYPEWKTEAQNIIRNVYNKAMAA